MERSHRLWDEMVPPPTRRVACRLTVTYAGFEGEGEVLYELYKRGLAQPQVGKDLYAGDGMLMFWHTNRSRRGKTSVGWGDAPRCAPTHICA